MQLLKRPGHTERRASSNKLGTDQRNVAPSVHDRLDRGEGRFEPQDFGARIVPRDPYAVWAKQREAERQPQADVPVRWVFRPRAVGPTPCSPKGA
jgi:hypothetical protein